MNFKKSCLIFTALLTTASLVVLTDSQAQSRTTEGISRQMTSLKNMIEAFANDIRPRLTSVENSITSLETRENLRTTCINTSGDPSIHWPTHPDADGRGCVSHDDMTGSSGTVSGCTSRPVQWTGAYGNPTCTSTAWGANEGDTATVTHPRPRCGNHISGSATVTCRNGDFVISNPVCSYSSDPCK